MAHFAKIENNIVTQVIVVSNDDCNNLEFPESESIGQEFIQSIGIEGEWKQTSYNGNFRKQFASVGNEYNQQLDVFMYPKRFDSWILDIIKKEYVAPVEYPTDGKYTWDEENQTWNSIT